MSKIISITLAAITSITLVLAYNFLQINMQFQGSMKDNVLLENKLDTATEKLKVLNSNLKEKQKKIKELSVKVSELAYPMRLKNTLVSAQATISNMNKELRALQQDNSDFKSDNFALNQKALNSDKEIKILMNALEKTKKGLAATNKQQQSSSFNNNILQLEKDLVEKDNKLKALADNYNEIKEKYLLILSERDSARDEVMVLHKRKSDPKISKKDIIYRELEARIKELRALVVQKEKEKQVLERKLSKVSKVDRNVEKELKKARQNQDDLTDLNRSLQQKIIKLSSAVDEKEIQLKALALSGKEVPRASDDEYDALRGRVFIQKERLQRVSDLYDHLKVQLKDVASILSKREETLSYKTREIDLLRDEVAYLKSKLGNMQTALRQSQESQRAIAKRLSEVANLNTTLHDQISDTSDFISRQKSPDSLLNEKISFEADLLEDQDKNRGMLSSSDKKRTSEKDRIEEMRKKVEVILHPF